MNRTVTIQETRTSKEMHREESITATDMSLSSEIVGAYSYKLQVNNQIQPNLTLSQAQRIQVQLNNIQAQVNRTQNPQNLTMTLMQNQNRMPQSNAIIAQHNQVKQINTNEEQNQTQRNNNIQTIFQSNTSKQNQVNIKLNHSQQIHMQNNLIQHNQIRSQQLQQQQMQIQLNQIQNLQNQNIKLQQQSENRFETIVNGDICFNANQSSSSSFVSTNVNPPPPPSPFIRFNRSNPNFVTDNSVTLQWKSSVKVDFRRGIVSKIINAVYPEIGAMPRQIFQDYRACQIIRACEVLEKNVFRVCKSERDYYEKIAHKINGLQNQREHRLLVRQTGVGKEESGLLPICSNTPNPFARNNTAIVPSSNLSPITVPSGQRGLSENASRTPTPTTSKIGMRKRTIQEESSSKCNAPDEKKARLNHCYPRRIDDELSIKETTLSKFDNKRNNQLQVDIKKKGFVSNDFDEFVHSNTKNLQGANSSIFSLSSPSSSSLKSFNSSIQIPKQSVADPKEMRVLFTPLIEKLFKHTDAKLFKIPFDKDKLCVSEYYDRDEVVKRPLDLGSLQERMSNDEYMSDPWNFLNDLFWVFINPHCTSKKNTRRQRASKTLIKIVEDSTGEIMRELGFCCGRQYFFYPPELVCIGKEPETCTIYQYSKYYNQGLHSFCEKCYLNIQEEKITIVDKKSSEDNAEIVINKKDLVELWNDKIVVEGMVTCVNCCKKFHKICARHIQGYNSHAFTCDHCLKSRGLVRKERLKAEQLPISKVDQYIESRVNTFLKEKGVEGGRIWVRVLSCIEKVVEVKPGMRKRYVNDGNRLCSTYPFRQKIFYAFQEIDGQDVAFFAMHVQEYGSECPAPNTRRVYIAYLDSVHYFQPKEYRTSVYHEILLGYIDYAKKLGYTTAHIWACPPSEGNDYIFFGHPPDQKVPKPKRLHDWYKKMLDKGINERIIIDYKDICRQTIEDNVKSIVQLPYMDGDHWPEAYEMTIKAMEKEERDLDAGILEFKHPKKLTKKKKASKKQEDIIIEQQCSLVLNADELSKRVMVLIRELKELFFVVRLHSSNQELAPIVDPDPLTPGSIVDHRDLFLENSKENYYEYSSLRRATYSTLILLKDLLPSDRDEISCDSCNVTLDSFRYTCMACEDFDLCWSCLRGKSHFHKMDPRGSDLCDEQHMSLLAPWDNSSKLEEVLECSRKSIEQAKKASANNAVRRFTHAVKCKDTDCPFGYCHKAKALIYHSKKCSLKSKGCPSCKQLLAMVGFHAKFCTIPPVFCDVPFCTYTKSQYKRSVHNRRLADNHYLKMRLDACLGKNQEALIELYTSLDLGNKQITHDDDSISHPLTIQADLNGPGRQVKVEIQQSTSLTSTTSNDIHAKVKSFGNTIQQKFSQKIESSTMSWIQEENQHSDLSQIHQQTINGAGANSGISNGANCGSVLHRSVPNGRKVFSK